MAGFQSLLAVNPEDSPVAALAGTVQLLKDRISSSTGCIIEPHAFYAHGNSGKAGARRRFGAGGAGAVFAPGAMDQNGFVLVPLVFSAHVTDAGLTLREAMAFAAFCRCG